MRAVRYILERFLHALPVFLGVTILVFLAIKLVPGDPIRIMMHGRISDQEVAAIYERLGMNRPLLVQYLDYVRKAATGDLGTSIVQSAPVSALVSEKIMPTLWLLATGTLISVLVASPMALLATFNRNRWVDHAIRVASVLGFAMPPFWIALLLILGFGLWLGWFPVAGFGDGLQGHLQHMFLPGLTVALFLAPILVQSLRSSMIDVMDAEYIEVARAKGLSEWELLWKHVLRNSLISAITILTVNVGWLISGAVIVEYVFSLPGLGSLLVRSVGYRDYPLIQGVSLVIAVGVIAVNLAADLSYALIDRRVLKK